MSNSPEELNSRNNYVQTSFIRPGDTVRVHAKVVEGTRERIQIFEGVVIKRRCWHCKAKLTQYVKFNYAGVERTFLDYTLHGTNRSSSLR